MVVKNEPVYALANGVGIGDIIILTSNGDKGVINGYALDPDKYSLDDDILDNYFNDRLASNPNSCKTLEEYFKKHQQYMYIAYTVEFDRDAFLNLYSSDLSDIKEALRLVADSPQQPPCFTEDSDATFMGVSVTELLYRYTNLVLQVSKGNFGAEVKDRVFEFEGVKLTTRGDQINVGVELF